jgi:hypothetical protein
MQFGRSSALQAGKGPRSRSAGTRGREQGRQERTARWGRWIKGVRRTAGVFEKTMADPIVEVQRIFLRRVVGAALPPNRQLFAETSQLPMHCF